MEEEAGQDVPMVKPGRCFNRVQRSVGWVRVLCGVDAANDAKPGGCRGSV
jgi:hypothetical protein